MWVAGRPRRVLRAVHDVVVDQGAGVHELQRGDRAQHRGVVLAGAVAGAPRASPSRRTAGRSRLPPVGQGADLVDDGDEAWRPSRRGSSRCRSRNSVERRGDRGAEPVEVGRRRAAGAGGRAAVRAPASRRSPGQYRPTRRGAIAAQGGRGCGSCSLLPRPARPAIAAPVPFAGRTGGCSRRTVPSVPVSRTVRELLASERPTWSFEFFPPKTPEGEAQLWTALRELERLQPSFVSVTYGAGGSTREGTVVGDRADRHRDHDDAAGAPDRRRPQRRRAAARGQPAGRGRACATCWRCAATRRAPTRRPSGSPTPRGCSYAAELVELIKSMGDFCVGVAAFPERHPRSPDFDTDVEMFVRQVPGRRRLRDHPDVLPARGLPAAARPGRRAAAATCRSSPGSCR